MNLPLAQFEPLEMLMEYVEADEVRFAASSAAASAANDDSFEPYEVENLYCMPG